MTFLLCAFKDAQNAAAVIVLPAPTYHAPATLSGITTSEGKSPNQSTRTVMESVSTHSHVIPGFAALESSAHTLYILLSILDIANQSNCVTPAIAKNLGLVNAQVDGPSRITQPAKASAFSAVGTPEKNVEEASLGVVVSPEKVFAQRQMDQPLRSSPQLKKANKVGLDEGVPSESYRRLRTTLEASPEDQVFLITNPQGVKGRTRRVARCSLPTLMTANKTKTTYSIESTSSKHENQEYLS